MKEYDLLSELINAVRKDIIGQKYIAALAQLIANEKRFGAEVAFIAYRKVVKAFSLVRGKISLNVKLLKEADNILKYDHFVTAHYYIARGIKYGKQERYGYAYNISKRAMEYLPVVLNPIFKSILISYIINLCSHDKHQLALIKFYELKAMGIQDCHKEMLSILSYNLSHVAYKIYDYNQAVELLASAAQLSPDNEFFKNKLLGAELRKMLFTYQWKDSDGTFTYKPLAIENELFHKAAAEIKTAHWFKSAIEYRNALIHFNTDMFAALEHINKAARSEPKNPQIQELQAYILEQVKDLVAIAEQHVDQNESSKKSSYTLCKLGKYHYLEKEYTKAIQYLDDALKHNHDLTDAIALKSKCYRKLAKQALRDDNTAFAIQCYNHVTQESDRKKMFNDAFYKAFKFSNKDLFNFFTSQETLYYSLDPLEKVNIELLHSIVVSSTSIRTVYLEGQLMNEACETLAQYINSWIFVDHLVVNLAKQSKKDIEALFLAITKHPSLLRLTCLNAPNAAMTNCNDIIRKSDVLYRIDHNSLTFKSEIYCFDLLLKFDSLYNNYKEKIPLFSFTPQELLMLWRYELPQDKRAILHFLITTTSSESALCLYASELPVELVTLILSYITDKEMCISIGGRD